MTTLQNLEQEVNGALADSPHRLGDGRQGRVETFCKADVVEADD
jgi:hypothetical protein